MISDGRMKITLKGGAPWGFRLSGGGEAPLTIVKIRRGSHAYDQGLQEGDLVISVNGVQVHHSQTEALLLMEKAGDTLTLEIIRGDVEELNQVEKLQHDVRTDTCEGNVESHLNTSDDSVLEKKLILQESDNPTSDTFDDEEANSSRGNLMLIATVEDVNNTSFPETSSLSPCFTITCSVDEITSTTSEPLNDSQMVSADVVVQEAQAIFSLPTVTVEPFRNSASNSPTPDRLSPPHHNPTLRPQESFSVEAVQCENLLLPLTVSAEYPQTCSLEEPAGNLKTQTHLSPHPSYASSTPAADVSHFMEPSVHVDVTSSTEYVLHSDEISVVDSPKHDAVTSHIESAILCDVLSVIEPPIHVDVASVIEPSMHDYLTSTNEPHVYGDVASFIKSPMSSDVSSVIESPMPSDVTSVTEFPMSSNVTSVIKTSMPYDAAPILESPVFSDVTSDVEFPTLSDVTSITETLIQKNVTSVTEPHLHDDVTSVIEPYIYDDVTSVTISHFHDDVTSVIEPHMRDDITLVSTVSSSDETPVLASFTHDVTSVIPSSTPSDLTSATVSFIKSYEKSINVSSSALFDVTSVIQLSTPSDVTSLIQPPTSSAVTSVMQISIPSDVPYNPPRRLMQHRSCSHQHHLMKHHS